MEFIFFGRLTLNKKTNRKDWCHVQLEKGSWHAKTNWSGLILSHQGPLCSISVARSCCWHQSSSWPVYASISIAFRLAVFAFLHRNTHCSMLNGPMWADWTKITEYPCDCLVNQHTVSDVPHSETNPTDTRVDVEVYVGTLTALPVRSSSHLWIRALYSLILNVHISV